MANFNVINAYDADVRIPAFKGLFQYGDPIGGDFRYAREAWNVETPGGVLQPAAAPRLLPATLPAPIETLAVLHRRWTSDANKDILIAAAAGQLYSAKPGAEAWTPLALPEGWEGEGYASSEWSFVTYEINPQGSPAPVDVLLLSNAKDGMVMVRGDTLAVSKVATPKKFGVIERYAERIWGGAIEDDPDMLVYSAPYDPENWTANVEIPEDGAGDILQPSWDGDSFMALRSFGSQLIAFKKTRVWRILGTDPGEYAFKEQYGGGAPCPRTISVMGEAIYLLGRQGVEVYDGLSVSPFHQQYASEVWDTMNEAALQQSVGCVWRDRYYVAFPADGSPANNRVMVFNPADGTWLVRDDLAVESFLATEDALYFTSAATPGQVWLWTEDAWESGMAASDVKWVSPWNDMSFKSYTKGGFEFYFTPETQSESTTITVSIETEKKLKTKSYTFGIRDKARTKRLHFSGRGRRFRVILESHDASVWRIIGGVHIIAELDGD